MDDEAAYAYYVWNMIVVLVLLCVVFLVGSIFYGNRCAVAYEVTWDLEGT